MFRPTLAITSATLVLLATNLPAMATKGGAVVENQEHCMAMMDQFNDAKTNNTEAIALAQKGWEDCGSSSEGRTENGVSELEDALKLINVTPDYDYIKK